MTDHSVKSLLVLLVMAMRPFGQCPGQTTKIPDASSLLTIDGNLDDAFWRSLPAKTLHAAEPGVPSRSGGEVRVGLRGTYLCVGAHLPEPGGKVLARSIGRNPVWEKDATHSPEVEDRIRFRLHYRGPANKEHELVAEVNPWSAYRLEQDGELAHGGSILAASAVNTQGWAVEAAFPTEMLDLERGAGSTGLRIQAERIRSRRPLAPEFHWVWPAMNDYADVAVVTREAPAPRWAPPLLGNSDPPLEVGRVLRIPGLSAEWDDPAWLRVAAFQLPVNTPLPRAPRYPTEVKWVQDGQTLALLIRATEPEPVVARAGGRDSAVPADDSITLYLATNGSSFLQVSVNPVGAIFDAIGKGPHIERPQSEFNLAQLQVRTNIRYGAWTARINVPIQECAAALGETAIPDHWRMVLTRRRAGRPGEAAEISALPVIDAETFYGPMRYGRVVFSHLPPSGVRQPTENWQNAVQDGELAKKLAAMDARVWSPAYRRYHAVRSMLAANMRARVHKAVLAERRDWESVHTRSDWERYRDLRLNHLRNSIGRFPPDKPPLDVRITSRHSDRGYRLENLVYQSRPGFYVPANLYLPLSREGRIPVIVIQHSQHYPRTQGELHDMGELWSRNGAAVLLVERLGFGERVETTPLYRQGYGSRYTFKKQLNLVGESHIVWMAWDLIRAVDMLCERPEIDPARIVLIGAVAGGGEPAALAAALDPRIAAVVPFNYDQGHIRLDADYPGEIVKQMSPWFITASIAPRRYVRAFEFGWEGAEEPDFPELWTSGWERSEKIWNLYQSRNNLASIQGYGLIRLSIERIQHCFSVGPAQRRELYPILERWFQIPSAAREDTFLPDSELTYHDDREAARAQEEQRRRPHSDLLCIPPAVSAELPRKPLHSILREIGARELAAAREARAGMDPAGRAQTLRDELRSRLGDIEPVASLQVQAFWTKNVSGISVEAIALDLNDGILLPLLLLRPPAKQPVPAVVAVAQEGKENLLAARAGEIAKLLQKGIAVCLPDLRGIGETSPDPDRRDNSPNSELAEQEVALGSTLLGARLKDLRTVIRYLRSRSEIDGKAMAIWGGSLAPANPANLYMDELQYEAGPQIQHMAEPLGSTIALLAALYEDEVSAVVAERGLVSFASVLDNAFAYVPLDAIVPGILKAGDVSDIASAVAPKPLLFADSIDARNIRLPADTMRHKLETTISAYNTLNAAARLTLHAGPQQIDIAEWIAGRLAGSRP